MPRPAVDQPFAEGARRHGDPQALRMRRHAIGERIGDAIQADTPHAIRPAVAQSRLSARTRPAIMACTPASASAEHGELAVAESKADRTYTDAEIDARLQAETGSRYACRTMLPTKHWSRRGEYCRG
jgi:hypothetical protein